MAESQLVEYKESWRDEYLKWICGFANAHGGTLYIGKRDDGSVCGVADAKKLMEDIPNKVRDALALIVDVDLISEAGLDKESFDIFRREAIRSSRMSADDLKLSNEQLLEKLNLLEGGLLKRAAETLLQKHRSLPHNPDIANTFFRAGFIESWGRGIEKICTLCRNYGIAEPEQTVHPNDIMMMFKANEAENEVVNENDGINDGINALSKTDNEIFTLLNENNSITASELCEKTDFSRPTVERTLKKLKVHGYVERIGSKKTGFWKILKSPKTL